MPMIDKIGILLQEMLEADLRSLPKVRPDHMFGREMKADLQINQMLSSYSLPNDQDFPHF